VRGGRDAVARCGTRGDTCRQAGSEGARQQEISGPYRRPDLRRPAFVAGASAFLLEEDADRVGQRYVDLRAPLMPVSATLLGDAAFRRQLHAHDWSATGTRS
jgi:hypothetical protein